MFADTGLAGLTGDAGLAGVFADRGLAGETGELGVFADVADVADVAGVTFEASPWAARVVVAAGALGAAGSAIWDGAFVPAGSGTDSMRLVLVGAGVGESADAPAAATVPVRAPLASTVRRMWRSLPPIADSMPY